MNLTNSHGGLIPADALAWWDRHEITPGFDYQTTWEHEYAVASTVAQQAMDAAVAEFRSAMHMAIAEGESFEDFRSRVPALLEDLGWRGKKAHRAELVFETNIARARSAGQYMRATANSDFRPYVRYRLGAAARHRPQHEAWAGTIARIGSEWAESHWPPCGFRCACWMETMDQEDLDEAGGLTEDPPSDSPDEGWGSPPS